MLVDLTFSGVPLDKARRLLEMAGDQRIEGAGGIVVTETVIEGDGVGSDVAPPTIAEVTGRVTFEMLRELVSDLVKGQMTRDTLRSILARFNVSKLSELDHEQYSACYQALKENSSAGS